MEGGVVQARRHHAATFIPSYPSKCYRSALIGIVVHSAQRVVILALVLPLVLCSSSREAIATAFRRVAATA